MTMKTLQRAQRGISMINLGVILISAVVLGTAGLKMVPVYMQNNTIKKVINGVISDSKTALLSTREIEAIIGKRFQVNQITVIKPRDLLIKKDKGILTISSDYEVREKLFYNVSVVMTFQDEFSKDVRQ